MIRLVDHIDVAGLGVARPSEELLRTVAAGAVGDPDATPESAAVLPVPHEIASIATAALHRVAGEARTGDGERRPWSAFVKVLQHPRHWSMIGLLPPEVATDLLASFPWREEIDTRAQALPVLPDGLRVPALHALDELADDRAALWMEDVAADDGPWSLPDYDHAARLLGALAARRTPDREAGASEYPPGFGIRKLVEMHGPIARQWLHDDALWAGPLAAGVVDERLRRDVVRALETTPDVLVDLDRLPLSLPHGDASPANLLRPRDEPGVLVAIDWAFGSPAPLGHDLGQLTVGGVESHGDDPARLPEIWDTVLPAYAAGLADEGIRVRRDTLVRGAMTSLVTRTLPSAFPVERAQGPLDDEQRAFLVRRAAMARFVVDLVLGGR